MSCFTPQLHLSGRKRHRAFSLVELLAVVAMISLLFAAVASVGFSDNTPARVRDSLVTLSSQLEYARQAAVAENTYAYVGLTTPGSGQPGRVAVFVSPTGMDLVPATPGAVSSSLLRQIGKISKVTDVAIKRQMPGGSTLTLPAGGQSPESGNLSAIQVSTASEGLLTFDRVVKFTPQGMALIHESPVEWIQFAVVPQRGAEPSELEVRQSSAVTVAGLTGRVFVQQP